MSGTAYAVARKRQTQTAAAHPIRFANRQQLSIAQAQPLAQRAPCGHHHTAPLAFARLGLFVIRRISSSTRCLERADPDASSSTTRCTRCDAMQCDAMRCNAIRIESPRTRHVAEPPKTIRCDPAARELRRIGKDQLPSTRTRAFAPAHSKSPHDKAEHDSTAQRQRMQAARHHTTVCFTTECGRLAERPGT